MASPPSEFVWARDGRTDEAHAIRAASYPPYLAVCGWAFTRAARWVSYSKRNRCPTCGAAFIEGKPTCSATFSES